MPRSRAAADSAGVDADVSPDGRAIAYAQTAAAVAVEELSRRHRVADRDHDVATTRREQVPQPADRSNDVDPMWIGGTLYFRSDRNGEFNLFSFDREQRGAS